MKKIGIIFFTVLVLISTSMGTFAAASRNQGGNRCFEVLNGEVKHPLFGSFTGTVKQITEGTVENRRKVVLVQEKNGDKANIVISKCTYLVNDEAIKAGDVITAFYDMNAPMILIYPPQYNAIAVAINKEAQSVKVDLFDDNLVSSDGLLKLNVNEKTEVILRNGRPFKGELKNKKLLVVYGAATKSIPALTTPSKVVVLCGNRHCKCH